MAEDRGAHTTQIIVAVIGLVGAIAAALFGNWDKVIGRQGGTTPSEAATAAQVATVPPPTQSAEQLGKAQERALDASTAALDDIASQIDGANQARQEVTDVSGRWRDTDGYDYAVQQQGAEITYVQSKDGVVIGGGQGRIEGRKLRYTFVSEKERGNCEGDLLPDSRTIAGECSTGNYSWAFRAKR
ncbi:hypothetical protein [Sphingomonas sp. DBB INV C78]|uniref:hypothetical protein n=1 Tax=Sphingomonas sp. DBB INV C78 TaxID=3349434 RepID=UPI0036D41AD7